MINGVHRASSVKKINMPCTDFNLVELWAGFRKKEEAVTKRENGHLFSYDGLHATAALTLCSCANDEVME